MTYDKTDDTSPPQVLDKNTVKLVAGEYDLLVIDKEEVSVTDAAKKSREFMELEDLDHAVSHGLRNQSVMCEVFEVKRVICEVIE